LRPSYQHMRRIGLFWAAVLGAAVLPAIAQSELEFPISPSPVGSGARAAGMADAFLAVADDATAASWNPAGLVQLERPEISVVGSFVSVRDLFQAGAGNPEFPGTHTDNSLDLNFLSAVYPLPVTLRGRNITVSLSYQQKFSLVRNFDFDFFAEFEPFPGDLFLSRQNISFDQDGSLNVVTPAIAFELTDRLSLGVAVNLWRDTPFADNGWEQTERRFSRSGFADGALIESSRVITERYADVRGENVVVGLLWNVRPEWKGGFRYDTSLRAEADFSRTVTDSSSGTSRIREQREISIPATFGFGTAWRPFDKLTLSLDISVTDWDEFYVEEASGRKFSLVDEQEVGSVDFDRTRTVRFGAEYVFLPDIQAEELKRLWSLRGGFFFDQEPASGSTFGDPNQPADGDPDNFYGIAAGVGLQAFQRLNFDFAYQFRFGNDVNADRVQGVSGFSEDVRQHRFLFSTVVYF